MYSARERSWSWDGVRVRSDGVSTLLGYPLRTPKSTFQENKKNKTTKNPKSALKYFTVQIDFVEIATRDEVSFPIDTEKYNLCSSSRDISAGLK